jgi:uncharacterized protein YjbI with pentapeptide repeats
VPGRRKDRSVFPHQLSVGEVRLAAVGFLPGFVRDLTQFQATIIMNVDCAEAVGLRAKIAKHWAVARLGLCKKEVKDCSLLDDTRLDLSRANLSGAYLNGANLSDAKLRSAKLRGANLSGADL